VIAAPSVADVVVIDGRYRIEAELGRGGMGVVHRGTQLALDRPVAIKRLLHSIDDDGTSVERFGASRWPRVASPTRESWACWTQVSSRARPISSWSSSTARRSTITSPVKGFLPVAAALAITAQIGDALASAHDAGILHRDVKPANVILARDGRARLLDFGLATLASDRDTRLTRYGVLVGTPDYLAPEIARGAAPDPRGDVYALGATLYEMLTGKVPFERATPMATVLAHLSDELVLPSRLVPGIDDVVDALVAELMARDPAERPRDARRAVERIGATLSRARRLTERDLDAVLIAALAGD
jgi:serine/threonine protein kinase